MSHDLAKPDGRAHTAWTSSVAAVVHAARRPPNVTDFWLAVLAGTLWGILIVWPREWR